MLISDFGDPNAASERTWLTLTNAGAESALSTEWVTRGGGNPDRRGPGVVDGVAAFDGDYYFAGAASDTYAKWDQQVAVPASLETDIDNGLCMLVGSAWQHSFANDYDDGLLYIQCVSSDTSTILATATTPRTAYDTWTRKEIMLDMPSGTRYVRIGTENWRDAGTQLSCYWDRFRLGIDNILPPRVYSMWIGGDAA